MNENQATAAVGDWVEAHAIHGGAPRRGQVMEIMGRPGHEHYRVRWDEQHESIVFPSDGVLVIPRRPRTRGHHAA